MDPGLSPCEVEAKRLLRLRAESCLRSTVETPSEAVRLEELVLQQGKVITVHATDSYSGEPQIHEDWVHLAEQVPSLLSKALPYVSNKEGMKCYLVCSHSVVKHFITYLFFFFFFFFQPWVMKWSGLLM
jgi:hypothetical protein